MKKRLFAVICMLFIFSLCGCGENTEKEAYDPAPFAGKDWTFFDISSVSHDRISFGEDGSFAYYCDAGEPVGDSDLYDCYVYDKEDSSITLYNDYDENEKVIDVLSYNASHLLLEIDGEIRDFTTVETDTASEFWQVEAESYLSGYELTRTITELSQSKIMTAAINYDAETDYPKDTFEEFALAEDVTYFDLKLFSQMKAVDGMENEVYYDVSYNEISASDIKDYLDQGGATAYLWLNDDMEIEKVVVFGMTKVTE